jgi:hypothetical protein
MQLKTYNYIQFKTYNYMQLKTYNYMQLKTYNFMQLKTGELATFSETPYTILWLHFDINCCVIIAFLNSMFCCEDEIALYYIALYCIALYYRTLLFSLKRF